MKDQRWIRAIVLITVAFGLGWGFGDWRAARTARDEWAARLEVEREATRAAGRALMESRPYPFINPEATHGRD